MNMAYVAGRFDVARRRPGLSFSHHAEVASLPPEEQEIWLDRAEVGGLSVRAVRHELREARNRCAARLMRALPPPDEAPLRTQATHEIVCPACGHHFDEQQPREIARVNGGLTAEAAEHEAAQNFQSGDEISRCRDI